ncbi:MULTISPECIES: hypothetical protein [unclassified Paraflavitalea]|uniref:hypothetical protein n=1 Tax=unclassified Paraflavitalea TaxID=2798305 RepID=UPI003D352838
MKKLFFVLAVAGFVACNDSGAAAEEKKDTAAPAAVDTTAKPVDTAAKAVDTAAKAVDTAAKK